MYQSQITFDFAQMVGVLAVQQHASQIVEHLVHVHQVLHGLQKDVQHGAAVHAHRVRRLDEFVFLGLVSLTAHTAQGEPNESHGD